MNIAICDDNYSELGVLETIIYSYYNENVNLFHCNTFSSGEELMEFQEKQRVFYQIYFLDIEMKELDGLQVASYIRSYDLNALIVFTTRHSDLVYKAFDVNAFHYLVKPLDVKLVQKVLTKAINFLSVKNTIFHFKSNKSIYTLNYDQIIYFESSKRKIIIYTNEIKYEYYGTFKQLPTLLNLDLFIQIHNSYIINMEYILVVENKEILLKNDIILSTSRKYYNDFMRKYREFILERLQ